MKVLLLKHTNREGDEIVSFVEADERHKAVEYLDKEIERSKQSSRKLISAIIVEGEVLYG